MTSPDEAREQTLLAFAQDRWLCHSILFEHRHKDSSPPAHKELVGEIYCPDPKVSIEGFRGFAKTTYLEEAAIVRAAYREFHNMVILGASYARACERLTAIKHEIEYNELLALVFGPLKGPVWQEGKIVLANGVCIQALGRDQSMLGLKYLEWRPDAGLIDDLEDPEEVRTDREREQTWRWFLTTFLPALADPDDTWVRALNTRRGVGSLPERLEKAGWRVRKFPIEYIDLQGQRTATWPGKFSLPKVDTMKHIYRGDMHTWMQEYMCQATSEADRVFTREMLRVVPRVRTWEGTTAMYDPARTTNRNSATTGKVVWSWIGHKLVIWDASAQKWKPDEIIADVFKTNEEFGPIWVGIEEDGLNEFILQPLRHEQVRRGAFVPIKALRAPRGKFDFIRGLQPFFAANEVEFAKPLPELEAQLLSFPTGPIDAPNALAYALSMRPGAPIYDGFTSDHVAENLILDRFRPVWLALNATRTLVTGALVQYGFGRTSILADWVIEGEPSEVVPLLVREVGMLARLAPAVTCPPVHWDRYQNIGLVQTVQKIPLAVEQGSDPSLGKDALREEFSRLFRGQPTLQISRSARHTLNALAGGYCRMAQRGGQLTEEPEPGFYRLLMEGIESCLGGLAIRTEQDQDANWAYSNGRKYRRYANAAEKR